MFFLLLQGGMGHRENTPSPLLINNNENTCIPTSISTSSTPVLAMDSDTKMDFSGPTTRSQTKLDIEATRHADNVDGTQSPSPDGNISVSSIVAPPSPVQNSFVLPVTPSAPEIIHVSSETQSIKSQNIGTQSEIVIFPRIKDYDAFQYLKIDFSPNSPCNNSGCLFADIESSGDPDSPLHYCTECHLSVCDRCYELGAHQHHDKYLKRPP
jgi:hypothetical protein